MIPVTKPFLPPMAEYEIYLKGIWDRNWLTNNGPLVRELEKRLEEYLDLRDLIFVSSGTIALQLSIKALGLKGEIITTPFSYVATTSSIVWEDCTPVFVDIDPDTFNINPLLIERAITPRTSAILATHVFGNPCDIDEIREIARRNDLQVIYDAAHCFGTKYKGRSVLNFGDISTISFHATKLFHTVEGGAVVTANPALSSRVSYMRNFGHEGPVNFNGVGINGKNSEFHAAMGLNILKYIDKILEVRERQYRYYDELLDGFPLKKQKIQPGTEYNHAYFPVLFEDEKIVLKVKEALEQSDIFPRRYFYPSLDELSYVGNFSTPVSHNVSKRILCLPMYHILQEEEQKQIADIVELIGYTEQIL